MFIKINNKNTYIKKATTILNACLSVGVYIPHFCYHKDLEIAGNCRMCLVEVKNTIKPVASCAMPIFEGIEIFTDSPKVKKVRESVIEFLLINHPLDCPICDQGGECDLQDQTMLFGSDRSRFFNLKRVVEDKNCGPFIKTIMTRCIHCSRCVRFTSEVCQIDNLGLIGRGNKTEISFYISKYFNSEFSGNIIDLCPVGALTSKPYAFKARPWDLKKTKTIDVLDTISLPIIIQSFNNQIVRILPQKIWITNKIRFFFDSFLYQRVNVPLLKNPQTNKFQEITWEKVFSLFNYHLQINDATKIKAVSDNFIDLQLLTIIKQFLLVHGISSLTYSNYKGINNKRINTDITNNFICNDFLKKFNISDLCVLINYNSKIENSYFHLSLINCQKRNNLKIFSIGSNSEYKSIVNLGLSEQVLINVLEGNHFLCKLIKKAKNPILVYGDGAINFENYKSFFITKFKNVVNLPLSSSLLNFLEISNINKNRNINQNLLFLYNTDSYLSSVKDTSNFIIYHGHHFTKDAEKAHLILPLMTFLEKKGFYLNSEGRIQTTNTVIRTFQNNENKIFLKNLLFKLNMPNIINFDLFFDYLEKLNLNCIIKTPFIYKNSIKNLSIKTFPVFVNQFYMTNILEKTSKTLMKSLNSFKNKNNFNL